MARAPSLILVVLGAALLAWGWDAYRSVGSQMSRLFTGSPTDRALLLLIVGGVILAAGLRGLSGGWPRRGP